jgi:transposase
MGRLSKRQKQSKDMCKLFNRRKEYARKCLQCWDSNLNSFNDWDLGNTKGRTRSVEENKLILLSLKMLLSIEIDTVKLGNLSVHDISWTKLEKLVAKNMHVNHDYVKQLRTSLFEDGDIIDFGWSGNVDSPQKDDDNNDEAEDHDAIDEQCVLTKHQVQLIVDEIDLQHSLGETITRHKIQKWLLNEHNIPLSKWTIGRYFDRAGLKYSPIKKKQRNKGKYRDDLLRDFLIELNYLYSHMNDEDCNYILCFTDESYCYQNHSAKNSYVHKDSVINKSTSKGERLIILHAITDKVPIAELDDNGYPICDLFQGDGENDNPKFYKRPDGKLTAECMWKASIRTGDYHDNMNSEMFYQWVVNKLVPTFEKLNRGKQMVLILDNAAYHHKREIGNLGSMKKIELKKVCDDNNVEHIDIPINEKRMTVLHEDSSIAAHIQGDGYCRVYLNSGVDVFARASSKNPMIPSVDELKLAIIHYLSIHKPEVLECQVEKFLKERGHRILWTPPYSPDLQPIELFWAAGKNYVAYNYSNGMKMRKIVELLRKGWYGDYPTANVGNDINNLSRKLPTKIDGLFRKVVKMANEKFIPMCPGLSGTLGDLVIDRDHEANYDGLPIDMLIEDLVGLDDDLDAFNIDESGLELFPNDAENIENFAW